MANNGAQFYDGFLARGFSPVQAAVLAGNVQQESGFNPAAYNAKEDALGGIQWRLDRKSGLQNYAQATGRNATDPDAQMDWVVQEMLGPEAKNAAAFLAATDDPAAAQAAIKKYIRWGDNSDGARLQNAMAFMAPSQAQPVPALDAISQATAGNGGNMLTGDAGGYVNPAFGNSPFQLPGTVQAPVAQPAAAVGVPLTAPVVPLDPSALPDPLAVSAGGQPAPAQSDDDLLGQFLPAAPVASPAGVPAAPVVAAPVAGSDDDLLQQWATPAAAPAPVAMPVAGEVAPTLTGYDPSVIGASAMAPGEPSPPAPEGDYQPSAVPFLDPINAFANAAVNAIPIVGPKLTEIGNSVDAGFNNMLMGGPDQTGADRAAINAAEQAKYPVAAGAGSVAGTVAPFVIGGAVPSGAKMLGMSGPVASRIGMGLVSGGAISGADTLARGGTLDEARNNALIGGAVGGILPAAAGVVNKLIAPAVSPQVAKLAQIARDQFGINISPAQISSNPAIKFLNDMVNKIPFSGGTASREAQQGAFNNAVSRTFGENADAITADVLENASTRIGSVFDDVAQRTPVIKADATFDQQMMDAMTNAQQTLTEAEMGPLGKQFDALVGKFQQGNNAIDGQTYQALTRKGTPLDLALHSPNPNIRHVAGEFREALDGALERSAAPDVMTDLLTARSQWKALQTVKRLAEKGAVGDVSPALLSGAVTASYKGLPNSGAGGDLANLARIGQQFLKPVGSSGTAERLLIAGGIGAAATGAAQLLNNPGEIIPTLLKGGAVLAGGRLASGLLRSPQLANMLVGNGLKGSGAARNALMAPAIPALVRQNNGVTPHQPLRITVSGAHVAQ